MCISPYLRYLFLTNSIAALGEGETVHEQDGSFAKSKELLETFPASMLDRLRAILHLERKHEREMCRTHTNMKKRNGSRKDSWADYPSEKYFPTTECRIRRKPYIKQLQCYKHYPIHLWYSTWSNLMQVNAGHYGLPRQLKLKLKLNQGLYHRLYKDKDKNSTKNVRTRKVLGKRCDAAYQRLLKRRGVCGGYLAGPNSHYEHRGCSTKKRKLHIPKGKVTMTVSLNRSPRPCQGNIIALPHVLRSSARNRKLLNETYVLRTSNDGTQQQFYRLTLHGVWWIRERKARCKANIYVKLAACKKEIGCPKQKQCKDGLVKYEMQSQNLGGGTA